MFFVLAEISGAHIFYFVHLFIIAFLQCLAMRGGLVSDLEYICFEGICLSVHLALQQILHIIDRVLESIAVFSAMVLQQVQLQHVDAIVAVNFLIDRLTGARNLFLKHFLHLVKSCIGSVYQIFNFHQPFLVLIQHVLVFKQLITVLAKLYTISLQRFLVTPLRSYELLFVLIDFFG